MMAVRMKTARQPLRPDLPRLWHGADYNPDQWRHAPEILREDIRLMKKARCNVMSVGIFAWSALEPEEGRFTFDWLDRTMDNLAEAGIYAILATPSGARPAWLAQKYPEVLRVTEDRRRQLFGKRHNHCFTSPVYREKCRIINTLLAERYKDHPALLIWHVSNEYGGTCHCPLCQEAFRNWLKRRYGTLDRLNEQWWSAFWSHTYTDWSQIESPSSLGESWVHGLNLDWRRFTTHQTVDFFKAEAEPLRRITPGVPVTTNFMGTYYDLDYWRFASEVDIVSWDSYPNWGKVEGDWREAVGVAFTHDLNRSLKGGRPWMLMESTPSCTNWQEICKPKKPGMHLLASLQAVAHGSDTVQYFQWRKSRGSSEKFHGAVIDHCGHENTRVFRDVAEVGRNLEKLAPLAGTSVRPEVAVIFDWENRWALDDAQGPRREKGYDRTCVDHYRPFWKLGIPTDVIESTCDFSPYRLIVAPMLYMVKPGVAERLEDFVRRGGTLVATYWTGLVNENDLCFLGGFPGPLRQLLGIWAEEIDALYQEETNTVIPAEGNALGLARTHEARELCELIHAEGAEVLATYGRDFYAGRPALTENRFGEGSAFYIASRNDETFADEFFTALAARLQLRKAVAAPLPEGVTAQMRSDGETDCVFLLNFQSRPEALNLAGETFHDMLTDEVVTGELVLPPLGVRVLRRS
jgi:Beta-galactosidase